MGHPCSEDNNPLQPDLGGELAHKCLARSEYMGPNLERKNNMDLLACRPIPIIIFNAVL